MRKYLVFITALFVGMPLLCAQEAAWPTVPVKRVFMVVLENTDYKDAIKQPFMKRLTQEGASLEKMYGVARPSQPNYIALVSGSTWGVVTNKSVTLATTHLGDLLEAKGLQWKVYADGYPGNCFLGSSKGKYVRKHVPFLSFRNVQTDAIRCARIVNSKEFAADVENGQLAEFSMYIPDDENNGHDTGVEFADRWLEKTFSPLLKNPKFASEMLFIVTFDESRFSDARSIYTSFWGDAVAAGAATTTKYNHYSMLRTIEDLFALGTLGRKDAEASPITGIWR